MNQSILRSLIFFLLGVTLISAQSIPLNPSFSAKKADGSPMSWTIGRNGTEATDFTFSCDSVDYVSAPYSGRIDYKKAKIEAQVYTVVPGSLIAGKKFTVRGKAKVAAYKGLGFALFQWNKNGTNQWIPQGGIDSTKWSSFEYSHSGFTTAVNNVWVMFGFWEHTPLSAGSFWIDDIQFLIDDVLVTEATSILLPLQKNYKPASSSVLSIVDLKGRKIAGRFDSPSLNNLAPSVLFINQDSKAADNKLFILK